MESEREARIRNFTECIQSVCPVTGFTPVIVVIKVIAEMMYGARNPHYTNRTAWRDMSPCWTEIEAKLATDPYRIQAIPVNDLILSRNKFDMPNPFYEDGQKAMAKTCRWDGSLVKWRNVTIDGERRRVGRLQLPDRDQMVSVRLGREEFEHHPMGDYVGDFTVELLRKCLPCAHHRTSALALHLPHDSSRDAIEELIHLKNGRLAARLTTGMANLVKREQLQRDRGYIEATRLQKELPHA